MFLCVCSLLRREWRGLCSVILKSDDVTNPTEVYNSLTCWQLKLCGNLCGLLWPLQPAWSYLSLPLPLVTFDCPYSLHSSHCPFCSSNVPSSFSLRPLRGSVFFITQALNRISLTCMIGSVRFCWDNKQPPHLSGLKEHDFHLSRQVPHGFAGTSGDRAAAISSITVTHGIEKKKAEQMIDFKSSKTEVA